MVRERTPAEELARGVILVLFGVIVLTVPAGFLTLALRIFGFVALLDGILAFVGLFRQSIGGQSQWALALEGVAGVGAGLLTMWWPSLTAFVLLTILGVWAFVTGGALLFSSLGEHAGRGHKALGLARAVLGIAFGLLLLAHPLATAATMVVVVGCYAIASGAIQIGSALVTRRLVSH